MEINKKKYKKIMNNYTSSSKNFYSLSPVRSPRKVRKVNKIIKSSVNLHNFDNNRPSFFSTSKFSNNSKYLLPRHQWSMKRDQIIYNELNSRRKDFISNLQSASYDTILYLLLKNKNNVKKVNIIVFCIDFITIILLSLSYFLFINNDLKLNKKINILRMISFLLSIINSILVVIRLIFLKNIRLMKYVLNIRLSYPNNKINYLKAVIEVIIHLLFPYPFFSYIYEYKDNIENLTIFYTSDMFLLIFSYLRVYTFFRLFLLSFDFRAIRLWKLFNNKRILLFKLKYLNQSHPIKINLILLLLFLLITNFLFQILENIKEKDKKLDFYNSFWILCQTIVNCGFGDYQIKTEATRLLIVFVGFFGLHFSISLIISILQSFEFQTENEIKAYQQIKLVYNKNQKNTSYSIYFEHYLKYKLIKIKETLKTHKKISTSNVLQKINISLALKVPLYHYRDNMVFKLLAMKNHLTTLKEKYFLNILGKLKIEVTFNDFYNYVKNKFDIKMKECITKTGKNIENISIYHDFFCDNITEYYHNIIETYYLSNKITNLMLLIFWTGGRFSIKDFDELVKYKVIGIKDFDLKYREFKLLYNNRNKKKKLLNEFKYSRISKESDLFNKYDYYYDDYESYFDPEDYEIDEENENENENENETENENNSEKSSN